MEKRTASVERNNLRRSEGDAMPGPTDGRFFGLPSTSMGRISTVSFVVGIVLVVLASTVLESVSVSIGELNVPGAVSFVVFLSALLTGAVALIRDREGSWTVWLSTGLSLLLVGFGILSSVMGA